MCGIAGLINVRLEAPPPDRDLALRMARALRHRGPDGYGIYRDKHVALAHARLSIIDLDGGWQPMANAEETLWVCFNGEIFNYIELREELAAKGHQFRTKSDTEILIHAYAEYGEAMVDRLNGQWAFVLWDVTRRRAFFSRDRVGINPLFWTVHEGVLRFASEVKALFQDPSIPRAFSREGLDEALTFWAPIAPLTPFAGIHQLPPGSVATLDLGRDTEPRVQIRWRPEFSDGAPSGTKARGDEAGALGRVRDALHGGSTIRLRADVPVGSYLSGGLDSTIVASLIASNRSVPLRTFSVEFADREFDEAEHQQAAVRHLGTSHTGTRCGNADIARVFPEVVYHAEAPLLRTAPAPLYILAGLVRSQGYRVVLTGEGADEFFAGYDIFREDRVRRFWARHPQSKFRPQLLLGLYPYLQRSPVAQVEMAKAFFGRNLTQTDDPFYSHRPRWDGTSRIKLMLDPSMREGIAPDSAVERLRGRLPDDYARWTPLGQAQYLEITTLLSGYLLSSQGERMMMANSVEGRFPFLDPEVMDVAEDLPDALKLRVLDEKYALKKSMGDLLPPGVLQRRKQPYRAPVVAPFFTPETPAYVDACLGEDAVRAAGIWQPRLVNALVAKCRKTGGNAMSNTDDMAFCAILSTQLMAQDLIDGARLRALAEEPTLKLGVDVDRLRASA
ncbi:asparagine synthase (glutamine-hydrolyzing) [Chondromyces apiculatus]|uniref:asparagine synthase (glutamine-hydrolyzing) n=1 Tax=Chondromyces apiculatus DSM 436 TaxID=1192034 RepID=A0A017T1R3_9BACT|nr:asparagine synthase (glutamine-hydrolyzing) [Chondromyces apiculatus]EYF03158.1 Asparagine synthetase / glutamine-hydrolyzing protein [Chondromyces apiculatus DSM 436]